MFPRLLLWMGLALAALTRLALADEVEKTFSLRSSVWSDSRSFDGRSPVGSLSGWFRLKAPESASGFRWWADGYVRNDQSFSASATQGTSIQGDFRELALSFSRSDWDLELGRVRIPWGRADGVNPTDVLQSKDFRVLVPADDDAKTGALTARIRKSWDLGDSGQNVSISVLTQPEFRGNLVAIPPRPGLSFRFIHPENSYRQFAVRMETQGASGDGAISYFEGIDRNPDLTLGSAGANGVDVALKYRRIQMLGADFSKPIGSLNFRTEVAMTWTPDREGNDFETKNPFFFAILGADRNFGDSWNLNLQYLYRHVVRSQDPFSIADPSYRELALVQALVTNQLDRDQHGISGRILYKALNDTLEVEGGGVVWLKRRDFVFRPRVRYQWNDRLSSTVGADLFRGPSQSAFGFLKELSTGFTEFSLSF